MMEIKQVYLKTRAEFGKQCIFDTYGPHLDEDISPDPAAMVDYIVKTHCNVATQQTKQFALHEAQTIGVHTKSSGMFHFEGGWPKEINPRDQEATARFRRRVEKDEEWAPKLNDLLQRVEYNVLQNGALDIYEHYFDDMIPTEMIKPRGLRTVNVYEDPETPARPVNDISWSPDSGSKMVVSYCFLELGAAPDYSNIVYIWQIDNPNKPWMTLEPSCATVVSEFNPRDPSVLAGGLMSGQVCSWDIRIGTAPVQTSHRQFSHRDHPTAVKWITTKSNTEFFSTSTDGRAMWWDTRKLQAPTEVLVLDLQVPNEQRMDRAIGISSANFEPSVSTKFMFGLENGVAISGSKKARTPADKLALRFDAHHGPIAAVDRNCLNPKIFLTIGNNTARVWAEDTRDDSLISTRFIREGAVGGCWNKVRHSIFYVTTRCGTITAWDLLMGLHDPILTMRLCEQKLTAIAAHEKGALVAVGSSAGNVYLVEATEALYLFDKSDRNDLASYLERCSRFVKATDARLKEIKLVKAYTVEEDHALGNHKNKKKHRTSIKIDQTRQEASEKLKEPRGKTKSVHKNKKKLKDEFPELQKVEEKFFEIVEKEKQKYEKDEDLTVLSAKVTPSMKKLVGRKIDKNSSPSIDAGKESKAPPKKVSSKKSKIEIPITEIAQDAEQEVPREAMTEESLPPSSGASAKSPVAPKEISRRKRRKTGRKKRPMPVAFALPRRKIGVCRPGVCRRGTAPGTCSTRSTDRAVRDRKKWICGEIEEETRSKDDVRIRTPAGRKGKMRQRKRESWAELLRARKRERPARERGERTGFLQEMTAPLEELAEDVTRAKKEIQEAWMMTRKLAKKASRRSATTAEQPRETPRRSVEREADLAKEVASTERILAARRGRKVRRATVTVDPCSPWAPPSLAEDLRALVGGPKPASIGVRASTTRTEI